MAADSQNPSLRARLTARLIVALGMLFLAGGAVSYWIALHYANEVYDSWLYDSVTSLAHQVRIDRGRVVLDLPRAAQEMFEWDQDDQTFFRVMGERSGHIAGQTDVPPIPPDASPFRNALLFDAVVRNQKARFVGVEVRGSEGGERVTVIAGETLRKRRMLAGDILFAVWIPQGALLVIGIFAIGAVLGRELRPLQRLADDLNERTHRSLEPVSEAKVPREMLGMTGALNDLLTRLRAALDAQRKFVADAAHQLRTPLAALQLHADRALREDDPAAMRAAMAEVRLSAERAVRLSNQLLSLARLEPGGADPLHVECVDLRELALAAGAEWVPRALERAIDLGFDEASPRASATADPVMLREALGNVIDNAIKFSPAGSAVTVSVERDVQARIVVEDGGPGIAPAVREQVLERFNQGDQRSPEGAGLGLAIAAEILALHGGSLAIGDAAGGGARIELILPLAQSG